jgi:thioredoxin reductase
MLLEKYTDKGRRNKSLHLTPDLAIAGGGLAGTCAAITAAREGLQVVFDSGPAGAGWQCFERSKVMDTGCYIAHGE